MTSLRCRKVGRLRFHGELADKRPPPQGCEPLASGDQFVDVFNTHLQSGNPSLCDYLEAISLVEALILSASVTPAAVAGWIVLKQKLAEEFSCHTPVSEIRKKQLTELNSFIAAQAARDRPAIVMGDFNLDGKKLPASSEYLELVKQLHLGATLGAPGDDIGIPWPNDYDWDIDHSDILRELAHLLDPNTMRWEYSEFGQFAAGSATSSTCSSNDHVSYPYNGCMSNWARSGTHEGSVAPLTYHYLAADLWDADSSSNDDLLRADNGHGIVWGIGLIALFRDSTRVPFADKTWVITDNSPIDHCTAAPSQFCFSTTPIELGPGQQF